MASATLKKRVLSGMRPTGKMHLGHLAGALGNWVELQSKYDCFYFVADWHALTSEYSNTEGLTDYAVDNVTDWIAVGLDPERSTLFVQGHLTEHAECAWMMECTAAFGELRRMTQFKEKIAKPPGQLGGTGRGRR